VGALLRHSLYVAGRFLGRVEGAVETAMLEVFHACRDIRVDGSPLRRSVLIGKVCATFILKALEALTE
jgi:hypothetical protein